MTAIEHQELKGITIRNLIVTIMGTASIVASVMTTYFNLRGEIDEIRFAQQTEEKVVNLRISILEGEVKLLQNELSTRKSTKGAASLQINIPAKTRDGDLLTSIPIPGQHNKRN